MTTFEAACRLKDVLNAAFAERPFGRAYVSDGSANWESEEALIVEWDGREPVPFGGNAVSSPADMSSGNMVMRAGFTIHALRWALWPTSDEAGNGPDPAQLQDNAALVLCDAETVMNALLRSLGKSELFGVCGRVEFVSQSAVIPEGGVVGTETKILVTL